MALEIAPGKTRIGWIGTGVMGSSMCGHLMAAGYSASVYNRTKAKLAPLVEKGATEADIPEGGRRQFRRHLHDRRLPEGRPGGHPRRRRGPRRGRSRAASSST